MGLSPRLLLKSSTRSASRAGSPSHSTQSAGGSLHSSASSLNDHQSGPSTFCHGPSPIATLSYGLYASASFSSTQSAESAGIGAGQQQKSAEEILRLVGEQKLCVIRKHGAQEETLVNSVVDGIAKASDILPLYLHVTQRAAGQLLDSTRRNGLPLIYLSGDLIGGIGDLRALAGSEFVANALRCHEQDLVVVGAGAGGIAAAKEASLLHKKVILIDVKFSNGSEATSGMDALLDSGTTRRLLCAAATQMSSLSPFVNEVQWNVEALRDMIRKQTHLMEARRQSWLAEAQVRILTANKTTFVGTHELSVHLANEQIKNIDADKFLLAFADSPVSMTADKGGDAIIDAQEFFINHILNADRRQNGRKSSVLCIGDQIRALEVTSVAFAFGYKTTIQLTGISSKEIDEMFMARICDDLSQRGVCFLRNGTLKKCRRVDDGDVTSGIDVHLEYANDESLIESYDLVINCDNDGASKSSDVFGVRLVKVQPAGGCSPRNAQPDKLWPPNVYRLGEPESVQMAQNLIRRLYDGYLEELSEACDTSTVICTPIPYAACGLSITQAIARYGADALAVYRGDFGDAPFLCQIVCHLPDQERLLGAQLFCPDAALHIDVFALAVRLETRRSQLDAIAHTNSMLAEILQCLKSVPLTSPTFSTD